MGFFDKLWAAIKEPIESAMMRAWEDVVRDYEEKPTRLFGSLPEADRKRFTDLIEDNAEAYSLLMVAIRAMKAEGLRVLDRINPNG